MTVTRDVVYDLLPAYFAGDASADSRALVESFLETDAEFAAMAARFKRLLSHQAAPSPADGRAEARTLDRARTAARRRGEFRGLTIGYALAAFALVGVGLAGYASDRAFIIAAAFAATAAICGAGWYLVDRRPEWVEAFSRHSGL
jgi:anti-sigma factor RsiW